MSNETKYTVAMALRALDSLDDYARMDIGVDSTGPRSILEGFIAQAAQIMRESFVSQRAVVSDDLKALADEVEACWICASIGEGEITLETINHWHGRMAAMLAAAPEVTK